jgi:release factor glutamine methyltransferase
MTAAQVDFGGLTIEYDERLLTPRDWTRQHAGWAARLLPDLPAGDVLELCAGAGQIGLLAVRDSLRRLVCVDLDPVAAEYITRNAAAAGMADRVSARTASIRDAVAPDERFPLIIADPPWVPRDRTAQYPGDPLTAIDGGPDGLAVTRDCLTAIDGHLAPGGVALLQLAPGDAQADAVAGALAGSPLEAAERRHYARGTVLRINAPGRSGVPWPADRVGVGVQDIRERRRSA